MKFSLSNFVINQLAIVIDFYKPHNLFKMIALTRLIVMSPGHLLRVILFFLNIITNFIAAIETIT